MEKLTEKQKRFVEEYILDLNGAAAVIRTGYEGNNPSELAYQFLQKKPVIDYVAELRREQAERVKVKVEDILQQYINLGTYDISDYFTNVYRIEYIRKDDKKGTRVKKKFGEVLTEEEHNELPERYKPYYHPNNVLKDFNRLTKQQRAAIQGVKYDKYNNIVLTLSNKQQALDSLARHLGMFIDKSEVKTEGVTRIINVNPTKSKT